MKQLLLLLSLILILSCSNDEDDSTMNLEVREDMRQFVQGLSTWSREIHSTFIVIPQNGHELFSLNGEPDGAPAVDYLTSIDGAGQEDLFYGYTNDNEETSQEDREWLEGFLSIGQSHGVLPLVTNYCSDTTKMRDGYNKSSSKSYISFSADSRELNNIPLFPRSIFNGNNDSVTVLADAKNFLYLLNPENFDSKKEFIDALDATNYDLFIIDLFYQDEQLTQNDIDALKTKPNGARRLAISYMSIGEAEDYRFYWNSSWKTGNPQWLSAENPEWQGNYKVTYWEKEWQDIIFGNDSSYLNKILESGFDGVYLDIIDGFEYFE